MTAASRQSGHSRKARFLEAFSTSGNVWYACEQTKIPRSTVYKWKEIDEKFLFAYNVANEVATERLEQEAYRRAHDGTVQEKPIFYLGQQVGTVIETDYSDGLLMFLLKARKPEKYKERVSVDVNSQIKAYGGIDVDAV